jgi:nicotinate-nucleotide adenylyltransferase
MGKNQIVASSKKIGVFGGMFNPIHIGHMNSIASVQKQMKFDKVMVVPAYQSPNRAPTEGPSATHRLEMTKQAFIGSSLPVEVSPYEINNEEISYTIKTLRHFLVSLSPVDLYLIIGIDQFDHFSQWKDFKSILESVNLVVTSRPESTLPTSIEGLNSEILPLIEKFDTKKISLKSGRSIYLCQLEDIEVSSTEIRKRLFAQGDCSDLIPAPAHEYIQKNNLYRGLAKKIDDFKALTFFSREVLESKKGINIKGYDLTELSLPSEYCLIASGSSTKQTSALAQSLTSEIKAKFGVYPQNVEGMREGRWVAIDYGQLMVHVFYDFARQQYHLEDLWSRGKPL